MNRVKLKDLLLRLKLFFSGNSSKYWDERYKSGGNSGRGSFGAEAKYKSKFINEFVIKNNIKTIIELGCGYANQLKHYSFNNYFGLDVSEAAINKCRNEFSTNKNYNFSLYRHPINVSHKFDLSISIDVIYHLVEDDIFKKYMHDLFINSQAKNVLIYSTNIDKNTLTSHVKHRNITNYITENFSDWQKNDISTLDNYMNLTELTKANFFAFSKK